MTDTASATATTGTGHEQLVLYCFNEAPDIGLEDISVFVTKVHAYLRLRKLPYTTVKWTEHNMKGLPRGKLPTLKIGERLVPDSINIISELEAVRPESERLDANLSAEQRAVARALREMVEESFYCSSAEQRAVARALREMVEEFFYWTAMVYTRWVRDDGWAATREKYFTHVPGIFKPFLGFFRGGIVKTYTGQGHGRRPEEEVISIANAQLDALSDFLGNKPYFMGDDITTLDMTMYGFLSAVKRDVGWYPNCPIRKHMQTKANLVEYVDRVAARVQPQS